MLISIHIVCVNKHTYIIFRFCTERCDPPHERCRRQPATGMGNSRIGSIRRGLCSKCSYISDDLPQPDGVMPCPKRRHASPRCGPVTDGAAAGTWTRRTDASGLHGVDVSVGLARMLLPGVSMGGPDTTGWRGPLVKARPCKVKGLDLVVNRSRVRGDGGPGG